MKKNKILLTEGYRSIAIIFAVSIILSLFISDFLGNIGFIVGIFMLYVFRDTYRHIFTNTQSVLAPIDSVVTAIDTVNGKHKIYCKVGLLNNHVLRAPIDGEVKVKTHRRGLNLNINSYKASLYNEQIVLKFDDIKLKLISGLCNMKMKYIKEASVSQGDKISVFLDGMVVITVPKSEKLLITIGDKLTSGQTILYKK
ncbi:MAG: phosphatidylserine decarboxylase [Arcobacteraceae bacterium]